MALSLGYSSNSHSEETKMQQIIRELFAKCLHVILESRAIYMSSRNYSSGDQTVSSPYSSASSSPLSVRPLDKWFNLALWECPVALENIDICRQINLESIVVDVILVRRPLDWDSLSFSPKRDLPRRCSLKERFSFAWNSDQEDLGNEANTDKILERWVLQYESRKTKDRNSSSRRSSNVKLHTLYKKLTLLLRSLYATVRLLPAYKVFKQLNSTGQNCSFTLSHRVSSFAEPFTCEQEAEMQKFGFTPVDTSSCRLCLSVMYHPSVLDVISEPSTPISLQIIPDYVGSPLANPLRMFPSLPVTGLPPHGSPSSLPISRQHSWSDDHYRASSPSISSSPSPTHSESHTSTSSHRFPPTSLPPHPSEMSLVQKTNTGFDEYYSSPNMSPLPSPSPQIYNPGTILSKALLRSESAPVCSTITNVVNSPGYSNQHNLPQSPSLRGSRTPKPDRAINAMQTGATSEKLLSLGEDECRKYYRANGLPRISFSRISSKSYQKDFDDPDFTCPFVLDNDNVTDPSSRAGSFDHDAAIGALVHMLKEAPPLHQIQEPKQTPEVPPPGSIMSSELIKTRKTTTDAWQEFQSYRKVKNLLLMGASNTQI